MSGESPFNPDLLHDSPDGFESEQQHAGLVAEKQGSSLANDRQVGRQDRHTGRKRAGRSRDENSGGMKKYLLEGRRRRREIQQTRDVAPQTMPVEGSRFSTRVQQTPHSEPVYTSEGAKDFQPKTSSEDIRDLYGEAAQARKEREFSLGGADNRRRR